MVAVHPYWEELEGRLGLAAEEEDPFQAVAADLVASVVHQFLAEAAAFPFQEVVVALAVQAVILSEDQEEREACRLVGLEEGLAAAVDPFQEEEVGQAERLEVLAAREAEPSFLEEEEGQVVVVAILRVAPAAFQ